MFGVDVEDAHELVEKIARVSHRAGAKPRVDLAGFVGHDTCLGERQGAELVNAHHVVRLDELQLAVADRRFDHHADDWHVVPTAGAAVVNDDEIVHP